MIFWIALASLAGSGAGDDAEPLDPRASVAPGSYFVGQLIVVRVSLVAEAGKPTATLPKVAGAEGSPGAVTWEPIATGGIGEMVRETRRYLFRCHVVPGRAGPLTIPPITIRLGDRSGRTGAIRLTVRDVPTTGRPASFLGGVGALQPEARASPATVRVGQTLEYEIRLTGPGALAPSRRPTLAGAVFDDLRMRVEPLPEVVVAEPPERTFRYRLRPSRAGQGSLPPVALATFDPKSERFLIRMTPAVPIRVEAVPEFDPSRLEYGDGPREPSPSAPRSGSVTGTAAVALVAIAAALLAASRLFPRRKNDPRRLARRFARGLDSGDEPARRITEGLAGYLRLAVGRPDGALTPLEASRGVANATGNAVLGDRAGRLIAECDRARFGGEDGPSARLVAEALSVFKALGTVRVVREEEGETEGGTLDRRG